MFRMFLWIIRVQCFFPFCLLWSWVDKPQICLVNEVLHLCQLFQSLVELFHALITLMLLLIDIMIFSICSLFYWLTLLFSSHCLSLLNIPLSTSLKFLSLSRGVALWNRLMFPTLDLLVPFFHPMLFLFQPLSPTELFLSQSYCLFPLLLTELPHGCSLILSPAFFF